MSTLTPSSPSSLTAPVLVQFQLGLFREVVRVPAGNLSYRHARRLAAEVIERKVTARGGVVSRLESTKTRGGVAVLYIR